jgi:NAD-dependent deacetylase
MNHRKKVVILSGAGISAESGIKTFRGADGLWENHRIEDVATPAAWAKNPELVLRFYDERRMQVINAEPNAAHRALAELEQEMDVHIVTQNIDDLHERAGSSMVLHLHGEIMQARSTANDSLVVPVQDGRIRMGETCPLGSQLRPHIVWFGEAVPLLEDAASIVSQADHLVIIGTSLNVYPAAGLVNAAGPDCRIYAVDPNPIPVGQNVKHIMEPASQGVPAFVNLIRLEGINQ